MKEKLFNISKLMLMAAGLLELAISQVHILMITKLFTRDVGFFLFIFILSGLMVWFNLSSMTIDDHGKFKQYILTSVIAVGSGIYFVMMTWNDYLTQESVMMEDIQASVAIILIGVVIYLVGCIAVVTSYYLPGEE